MLVSTRNGNESEATQSPAPRATPAPVPDHAAHIEEPQTNLTVSPRPIPLQFRRAIKRDAKVRLAITGPSGSGKTYTLLKLASDSVGPSRWSIPSAAPPKSTLICLSSTRCLSKASAPI